MGENMHVVIDTEHLLSLIESEKKGWKCKINDVKGRVCQLVSLLTVRELRYWRDEIVEQLRNKENWKTKPIIDNINHFSDCIDCIREFQWPNRE